MNVPGVLMHHESNTDTWEIVMAAGMAEEYARAAPGFYRGVIFEVACAQLLCPHADFIDVSGLAFLQ